MSVRRDCSLGLQMFISARHSWRSDALTSYRMVSRGQTETWHRTADPAASLYDCVWIECIFHWVTQVLYIINKFSEYINIIDCLTIYWVYLRKINNKPCGFANGRCSDVEGLMLRRWSFSLQTRLIRITHCFYSIELKYSILTGDKYGNCKKRRALAHTDFISSASGSCLIPEVKPGTEQRYLVTFRLMCKYETEKFPRCSTALERVRRPTAVFKQLHPDILL